MNWEPEWIVRTGSECQMGIAIDDGCFIVLRQDEGEWKLASWIPSLVAAEIVDLLFDPRVACRLKWARVPPVAWDGLSEFMTDDERTSDLTQPFRFTATARGLVSEEGNLKDELAVPPRPRSAAARMTDLFYKFAAKELGDPRIMDMNPMSRSKRGP